MNLLEGRAERLLAELVPATGLIYVLDLRALCRLAGHPVSAPAGLAEANRLARRRLKRGDGGAIAVVTLWANDRAALSEGETERDTRDA